MLRHSTFFTVKSGVLFPQNCNIAVNIAMLMPNCSEQVALEVAMEVNFKQIC